MYVSIGGGALWTNFPPKREATQRKSSKSFGKSQNIGTNYDYAFFLENKVDYWILRCLEKPKPFWIFGPTLSKKKLETRIRTAQDFLFIIFLVPSKLTLICRQIIPKYKQHVNLKLKVI